MSKLILLSPNFRARVEARVRELMWKASRRWGKRFSLPKIRYDLNTPAAGVAYHKLWLIRLNLSLLIQNERAFFKDTIPHEVAHLISRSIHGQEIQSHGKEWVEVMRFFNAPARRTHTYWKNCGRKM